MSRKTKAKEEVPTATTTEVEPTRTWDDIDRHPTFETIEDLIAKTVSLYANLPPYKRGPIFQRQGILGDEPDALEVHMQMLIAKAMQIDLDEPYASRMQRTLAPRDMMEYGMRAKGMSRQDKLADEILFKAGDILLTAQSAAYKEWELANPERAAAIKSRSRNTSATKQLKSLDQLF